jgi:hypothetical protein
MDRRTLLRGLACSAVIPVVAGCSSSSSGDENAASCDGAGARTSTDSGHFHDLCIPAADLNDPPAGATYQSTVVSGHTHSVELDESELASLAAGGSVSVTTSVDDGHVHTVTLRGTGTQ